MELVGQRAQVRTGQCARASVSEALRSIPEGDAIADATADASASPHGMYNPRGVHWLIDCFDVDAARLVDATALGAMLCNAAIDAGARILFHHFHRFGSEDDALAGITGVVLLAESHITIHTWPERRFAAIDLFLCGATRPELALARVERELAPARIVTTRHGRGEVA